MRGSEILFETTVDMVHTKNITADCVSCEQLTRADVCSLIPFWCCFNRKT